MLLKELSLACRRCGHATPLEVSYIQASRSFTCRHCGARSPIDKDRAAEGLARLEQAEEHAAETPHAM